MRAIALILGLALSVPVSGQAPVISAAPERVAVTIYRNGDRGLESMNLSYLGGYALVSENRRVKLPAGESELRFEGVTSGIVPQSAIVTGLGQAVLEKNRDARLLSPGSLLDASLGERVMLRRTDRATGKVTTQDAIVRATAEGVILQTAEGVEALRCTGLAETPIVSEVPAGLSAKPTLSVRVRSPEPIERNVTLSYITNNFDWEANYIADLSPAGDRIYLFAWLTLANGDATGLANAETQAVAGKLNRESVRVDNGQYRPIRITCWPQGKTNEITDPNQPMDIVVTGSRIQGGRLIPPPPPPAAERGDDDGFAMNAIQERLGDVKLYRIPERVTVASRSQKQVAMIRQPSVKVASILRVQAEYGDFSKPADRVLITRNRSAEGLGLPLPAGNLALFGVSKGRRILIGQGSVDDHAVGEKVEIKIATATGVLATQKAHRNSGSGALVYELLLTNDMARQQVVEVELPADIEAIGRKLVARGDKTIWRVAVPANGTAMLRWRS